MSTYLHTCTSLVQNAAGANLPNSSTNWIITPPICSSLLTRSVLSTWRSVTRTRSSQEPSIINPFILLTFDTSLTSNPAGQHIQNKQLSVFVLFSNSFQQIALGKSTCFFKGSLHQYCWCQNKVTSLVLQNQLQLFWYPLLAEDGKTSLRTYDVTRGRIADRSVVQLPRQRFVLQQRRSGSRFATVAKRANAADAVNYSRSRRTYY